MKSSWKTTLFGAITAAGVAMAQSDNAWVHQIGALLAIVGPLAAGLAARDNAVTDQAAGASTWKRP